MTVHYNVWGASGSYAGYNPRVVDGTNNVWTRLVARQNHIAAISLNELCVLQSLTIASRLASNGYSYGGWFQPVRNDMQREECGDHFGIAVFVNGGTVGQPVIHVYPPSAQKPGDDEQRAAICIRNLFHWSCTTHLAQGAVATSEAQSEQYNDIATFLASSIQGVYASGDFNMHIQPPQWYGVWTSSLFLEADTPLFRVTRPASGTKLDYTFRKNPAVWSHGAYLAFWSDISDHAWLQGYL